MEDRQEFEKSVRNLGIALYLAYEHGRGYIDADTWKAFAVWQARTAQIDALRRAVRSLIDADERARSTRSDGIDSDEYDEIVDAARRVLGGTRE